MILKCDQVAIYIHVKGHCCGDLLLHDKVTHNLNSNHFMKTHDLVGQEFLQGGVISLAPASDTQVAWQGTEGSWAVLWPQVASLAGMVLWQGGLTSTGPSSPFHAPAVFSRRALGFGKGCGSTVSAGQPEVPVVLSGERLGGRRGHTLAENMVAGIRQPAGFSDASCLQCVDMYPNASPFCLDVAWASENQEKLRRLRRALGNPKCRRLLRVPGLGAGECFPTPWICLL